MGIKQMRNNFTTPEQSKRLLELGVPADSADCFFYSNTDYSDKPHILYKKLSEKQADYDNPLSSIKAILYPCWSVGRLMEIYLTCAMNYHPYDDFYTETPSMHFMAFDKDMLIDEIIGLFDEDEMDFSKLEE